MVMMMVVVVVVVVRMEERLSCSLLVPWRLSLLFGVGASV
jgi:hypothetical protein